MVYTGTFATVLEVQEKVGVNASAVSNVEAYIQSYVLQAESKINVATLHNWTDAYATLNADVKGILTSAAASLAAMEVLNYDPTGISIREFQTRLDVLRDGYIQSLSLLRDIKQRDFMVEESP